MGPIVEKRLPPVARGPEASCTHHARGYPCLKDPRRREAETAGGGEDENRKEGAAEEETLDLGGMMNEYARSVRKEGNVLGRGALEDDDPAGTKSRVLRELSATDLCSVYPSLWLVGWATRCSKYREVGRSHVMLSSVEH